MPSSRSSTRRAPWPTGKAMGRCGWSCSSASARASDEAVRLRRRRRMTEAQAPVAIAGRMARRLSRDRGQGAGRWRRRAILRGGPGHGRGGVLQARRRLGSRAVARSRRPLAWVGAPLPNGVRASCGWPKPSWTRAATVATRPTRCGRRTTRRRRCGSRRCKARSRRSQRVADWTSSAPRGSRTRSAGGRRRPHDPRERDVLRLVADGPHQSRDRRPAVHQREDRQRPRLQRDGQARRAVAVRGGRGRREAGTALSQARTFCSSGGFTDRNSRYISRS